MQNKILMFIILKKSRRLENRFVVPWSFLARVDQLSNHHTIWNEIICLKEMCSHMNIV